MGGGGVFVSRLFMARPRKVRGAFFAQP